ncbi:proton extrusion protein PcxA [Nostoc sp. UHCC 0302]|uniref:proton extrusion protein PcxA n=1 Tax=Nostoc sp. UHCC 0302 TaxID=3134896 RepID=UPI00311CC37B
MKASFFKKNTGLIRQKLQQYWRSLNHWLLNTPERALLEAYEAAQGIKSIEIQHFGGKKISRESVNFTENVMSYWQGYLSKKLTIIKLRLAEFKLSRGIVTISNADLLEKLNFIDEVIEKYSIADELISDRSVLPTSQPLQINRSEDQTNIDLPIDNRVVDPQLSQKNGAFPRSIGRTINRITADLSPQAEETFLRDYRLSRYRTRTALRFLILLVIVPLLTQYLSKQFLVNPIVERIRGESTTRIFINSDMETEALQELHSYEQKLKFEYLLHIAPPLSSEEVKKEVKNKAIEIAEEFRNKSSSSISNVFADFLSLIAFGVVVALSKKEIVIVKSFIDNIVYGLSDSAKAFLIILFTDIFVGFHSPHGWEVILEELAGHLGLPASRNAIYIFIATFPVILNTIFKYWIFRYLSRLSPSALATLKEMDE